MQRYVHPCAPKSDEVLQLEKVAAAALDTYFNSGYGVQAMVARDTGIPAPMLTKMRKGTYPVGLEQALLLEMASGGELQAGMLCPSRADLIEYFLQLRAGSQPK